MKREQPAITLTRDDLCLAIYALEAASVEAREEGNIEKANRLEAKALEYFNRLVADLEAEK